MNTRTRELIREFNLAFHRPVNESWTDVTVSERELLGKLLIEEAVEYVTLGLGLDVKIDIEAARPKDEGYVRVSYNNGPAVNPVECVDGLADVNVVIHHVAHWHGFNLDMATEIVHDSNMSKLDENGNPIINGLTPGYRQPLTKLGNPLEAEDGFDSAKPIGKILKGLNFLDPQNRLQDLIRNGRNTHE